MGAYAPAASTTAPLPQMFIVSGVDIATVDAAVLTKVKSLATAYGEPVSGQTRPGTETNVVINGSIVVDPVQACNNGQGTIWYTVSIRWEQLGTPA